MTDKTSTITEGSQTGSRVVYPTHRNEEQIPILLRKIEPDERALGLVLDSWTKTVAAEPPWDYSCTPHTPPLPPTLLIYEHDTLLKKIIPHSTITLACDPDDPDTVWGYVCTDGDLLHFIYVKSAFRGFGIGGCLLRAAKLLVPDYQHSTSKNVSTSHRTKSLFVAFPGVRFHWNPYRMIYGT